MLAALVGKDVHGLSAGTISRFKAAWQNDYRKWQQHELSHKRYVYFWADGIYFNVRLDARQCLLVNIGTKDKSPQELVALGFWKALSEVFDTTA